MNSIERSIPEQKTGLKKEFFSSRKFISLDDAQLCYVTAIGRLLHINHWHELAPQAKSVFRIMSRNGKPQRRRAKLHDYICISVPAPNNGEGNGDDWVQVVTLKFLNEKHKEQCLLTLKPCPMPGEEHTAHFFSGASTSSFLITRQGKIVTAAYYGHNESPNTDTSGLKETVRNVVVATGAALGFSNLMWQPLTESLIMDGTKLRERAQ